MSRRVILGALLLALCAGPAPAQQAGTDGRGPEIRSVITSQIEAMKAEDFETAFGFASPAIRRALRSAAAFRRMVVQGYPMVWNPADVRFVGLEDRDGQAVQGVMVIDQQGALYVLDYAMVPGEDGWRINGVTVRRPGDAGA